VLRVRCEVRCGGLPGSNSGALPYVQAEGVIPIAEQQPCSGSGSSGPDSVGGALGAEHRPRVQEESPLDVRSGAARLQRRDADRW